MFAVRRPPSIERSQRQGASAVASEKRAASPISFTIEKRPNPMVVASQQPLKRRKINGSPGGVGTVAADKSATRARKSSHSSSSGSSDSDSGSESASGSSSASSSANNNKRKLATKRDKTAPEKKLSSSKGGGGTDRDLLIMLTLKILTSNSINTWNVLCLYSYSF